MKPENNLSADLWRLSIIGELIHRHSDDGRTLTEHINDLAAKKYLRLFRSYWLWPVIHG